MPWTRDQIAARAAQELVRGDVVNLGIGIPTLVANHLRERLGDDHGIVLHSENGLLGMGPFPTEDEVDAQIINAGKQTVTVVPGGSTFDSSLSFAMIRGGHVDVAILGAMEVSERGDLANWMVPGEKVAGIGGAMDLATGARKVIALMTHTSRKGEPKLVPTCSLPLTATSCVNLVISDLAVIEILPKRDGHSSTSPRLKLVELAPEVTVEMVRRATGAPLDTSACE